jgi:hypothetical protein
MGWNWLALIRTAPSCCERRSHAGHVKCVLTHINSDGGYGMNGGLASHGRAPCFENPQRTLSAVGGGSAAASARQFWLAQGESSAERIEVVTDEVDTLAKSDDNCRRMMTLPGIGPIISSAMVAAIGN